MIQITEFIALLKIKFPEVKFFNSTIDKSITKCVGIYRRQGARIQAIGDDNGSYDILPISMVIHWTEDAGDCEIMANVIYTTLSTIIHEQTPSGKIIYHIQLQDSNPVWVGRDSTNVAENVIRANIYYERGV